MAAMMAAARRPLPLPAIGAAAFGFAEPVVKAPPVVEAVAVAMVLAEDLTVAAVAAGMVLASLFSSARISVTYLDSSWTQISKRHSRFSAMLSWVSCVQAN